MPLPLDLQGFILPRKEDFMEIKAIETIYNGYKFRSRLEARWAVFFDKAGIEYEYEPEGFDIGGVWYLPDFYLPWYNCYVEIKPKNSEELIEAENKLINLFYGKDDCCCMLCVGEPINNDMTVYCNSNCASYDTKFKAKFLEGVCWSDKYWHTCGKHFISLVLDVNEDAEFFDRNLARLPLHKSHKIVEVRNDLECAKIKARQSRFEHGEKG